MMILILTALMASAGPSDPDGLHRRVMRTAEDGAGWQMHLRLDRDALLSGIERRLLAEARLRRPRPGGRTASVTVQISEQAGRRSWRRLLILPCNEDGTYCQLRWEVEASLLPHPGLYRLRMQWPEAGRLALDLDFSLRKTKKGRPRNGRP